MIENNLSSESLKKSKHHLSGLIDKKNNQK